ncbi:MAG: molybdenum cofactor biosynthesis protein MoaE [bacterium]|nr:molybdenum cofactor biosynthesis protein MoaE [bacterium]
MYITDKIIDIQKHIENVSSPSSGALVTFSGTIRNNSDGKEVTRLDYEANISLAETILGQINSETERQFPVDRISMQHRIGTMEVGETSVFIAVSAPHRKEAFEACKFIIDRIKEIAPIWKKELFKDGYKWADGSPVNLDK